MWRQGRPWGLVNCEWRLSNPSLALLKLWGGDCEGTNLGLSSEQKLVLWIDEYDRAITDLLENEQKVTEHVATLKNFYSVLKTTASVHIHWCFLTGISKYGKLSVFSDLNNLLDITTDERFATLLGYTQEELESYFPERIDGLATRYAVSRAEMLEAIRFWYNGFSWDGKRTLYVPFSTLVF